MAGGRYSKYEAAATLAVRYQKEYFSRLREGSQSLHQIRLMAEVQCWPLWWDERDAFDNVDPATLGLSTGLMDRLKGWADKWASQYDLVNAPVGVQWTAQESKEFDLEGIALCRDLQRELKGRYHVVYHSHRREPLLVARGNPMIRELVRGCAAILASWLLIVPVFTFLSGSLVVTLVAVAAQGPEGLTVQLLVYLALNVVVLSLEVCFGYLVARAASRHTRWHTLGCFWSVLAGAAIAIVVLPMLTIRGYPGVEAVVKFWANVYDLLNALLARLLPA